MAEKSVDLYDVVDPSQPSQFESLNKNIKEFSKNDNLINSLDPKLLTNGPLSKTDYAINLRYSMDHNKKEFSPQKRAKNSTLIAVGKLIAMDNRKILNEIKNSQKQNPLEKINKAKNEKLNKTKAQNEQR
mgnify:CR=1 FL=1